MWGFHLLEGQAAMSQPIAAFRPSENILLRILLTRREDQVPEGWGWMRGEIPGDRVSGKTAAKI